MPSSSVLGLDTTADFEARAADTTFDMLWCTFLACLRTDAALELEYSPQGQVKELDLTSRWIVTLPPARGRAREAECSERWGGEAWRGVPPYQTVVIPR